jgi:predicted TIM-barrel fold metal-dependent hydrolase
MLTGAGVGDWIVDTGYQGEDLLDPAALADLGGGRAHEVVRLESLAESLVASGTAAGYPDDFADLLGRKARDAVGFKTIVAYRAGFDLDWSPPDRAEVVSAAGRWFADPGPSPRLADPVLLRHGIHTALGLGLPLQIHVGLGDRDLDLRRVDPMLLLDLLRQPAAAAVPILLLHCYPYHRQAGYLAQAFPNVHLDVGLAVNHLGARAPAVVAESLELAPFAKILYSSDAWGPAELHCLGAVLWRRAMAETVSAWVDRGDWSLSDARRVLTMIGQTNARRVYGL